MTRKKFSTNYANTKKTQFKFLETGVIIMELSLVVNTFPFS